MAEQPDPVDRHVGQVIRARRLMAGVTQEKLGQALEVSFQQIQKYERATTRVAPSRLARIARFLNAPISAFFPDADEARLLDGIGPVGELAGVKGGLLLARYFMAMDDKRRHSLLTVAKVLHDDAGDAGGEEPGRSYVSGGDEEARLVAG